MFPRVPILMLLAWFAVTYGDHQAPRFSDYPVRSVYRGKTAPLHPSVRKSLASEEPLQREKSGIPVAEGRRADFAGHYVLITGNCGAACLNIGALDAKTGRVYWLGHTLVVEHQSAETNPVEYRLNSTLLILHGERDEKESDNGTHYYQFVSNRFVP